MHTPIELFLGLDTSGAWLSVIVDATIKGTLILLAASLAIFLLRAAPATQRHRVRALTVGALLALPIFLVTIPPWRLPVSVQRAATANTSAIDHTVAAPIAGQSSTNPLTVAAVELRREAIEKISVRNSHIALTVAILWLAGCVLLSLRLLRAFSGVLRIGRQSLPLQNPAVLLLAAKLARQLGVRRRVRIVQGDATASPMTWGWLRPVILLPVSANDWSEDRLRRILLHELAHIRRNDWVVQIAADLVAVIYWFNPLVWIAAQRVRFECEVACDDMVVGVGERPSAYASDLVEIVRSLRNQPSAALVGVGIARSTMLHARLHELLKERVHSGTTMPRATLFFHLGVLALTVVLAGAHPATVTGLESAPQVSPCWELVPGTRISHITLDTLNTHIGFSRSGCNVEIHVQGKVRFTGDFAGIASLEPGARVLIIEERKGVRRRLEVLPGGDSTPRFAWTVARARTQFDAQSQEWLTRELVVLFRMGGYAARERTDSIFSRSGVAGVLVELPLIMWGTVRLRYETRLIELVRSDRVALLSLMRTGPGALSDSTLSELLVTIAAGSDLPLTGALRNDYMRAANSIHDRNAFGRALGALLR